MYTRQDRDENGIRNVENDDKNEDKYLIQTYYKQKSIKNESELCVYFNTINNNVYRTKI